MTDPISNRPRPVPTDNLARKGVDKAALKPGGAAGGVVTAPATDSAVALSKSSLVDHSADIAGFKKISERLKKEPDFDRSKVDSIKQAIQNGQYPLNPRRIAESFVALENLISN
jgi:negative regulator of flagellin synthesis FlgM